MTLAGSGIGFPCHDLEMASAGSHKVARPKHRASEVSDWHLTFLNKLLHKQAKTHTLHSTFLNYMVYGEPNWVLKYLIFAVKKLLTSDLYIIPKSKQNILFDAVIDVCRISLGPSSGGGVPQGCMHRTVREQAGWVCVGWGGIPAQVWGVRLGECDWSLWDGILTTFVPRRALKHLHTQKSHIHKFHWKMS